MAFYIYEQPAFVMEHFHPAFSQPLRTLGKPRHLNFLENLFDQEKKSCEPNWHCSRTKSVKKSMEKSSSSSVQEGRMDAKISKANDENKIVEPTTKTTSKKFMSRVSCHENMEEIEIKIQLHGHKFKVENFDVQVINDNILVVKAEDDKETFEKKFKLPSNVLVDKIESKFDVKEENAQTLAIHVPKDNKRTQVPISLEKSMEKSSSSSVQEGRMEAQISKSNDENKIVEPVTKTTSKQFMSRVSCQEDLEKVEIKIQHHGHKFKEENFDVQVINDNILVVKAEDDKETFEKKFKLPSNVLVDKIESKFDVKEENAQTLAIHVPKDNKRTQVPISLEKSMEKSSIFLA